MIGQEQEDLCLAHDVCILASRSVRRRGGPLLDSGDFDPHHGTDRLEAPE